MAIESIAKTLGAGSGIDVGALVTSLVEAQFAAKNADFTRREEKLTAQISGVSALKSAITNFDAALKALTKGGTLAPKPVSADPSAIQVSLLPDATVKNLSVAVAVTQLASAQASTTNRSYDAAVIFKEGTITIGFTKAGPDAAAQPKDVTLTIAAGQTLQQVADQINGSGQVGGRVSAMLVKDGTGSRLVFKATEGAEKAFTVTATDRPDQAATVIPPSPAYTNNGETLDGFDVGASVTAGGTGAFTGVAARDAILTMDGAQYRRTSNTVADLIPGLKLELLKVTAAPVGLSSSRPGGALSEAATNFVAAYNEMLSVIREQNDPFTGVLRNDSGAAVLQRSLGRLTTEALIDTAVAGAPRTLADLGIRTARDGTLSVDDARLTKMVADFPTAVEAMFAQATGPASKGLSAALSAITKRVTDKNDQNAPLNMSAATYTKQLASLSLAKEKASVQTTAFRERLTRQFATMDARTAAYKSTQTFLDNQIKAWNRSDA
ncbi:flagellar filament capping protein FliD [uncultured Sphingomonas sp.]|uniref:flagellar filament capping protein FliD n=1 Tax=uncultured Sphingomonas sp. TaxID=158754 RepID=UPI0035C9E35A